MHRRLQRSTLFPYTTLFRSWPNVHAVRVSANNCCERPRIGAANTERNWRRWSTTPVPLRVRGPNPRPLAAVRSEEHTSELQSQFHLVCRLLLEKKKKKTNLN